MITLSYCHKYFFYLQISKIIILKDYSKVSLTRTKLVKEGIRITSYNLEKKIKIQYLKYGFCFVQQFLYVY